MKKTKIKKEDKILQVTKWLPKKAYGSCMAIADRIKQNYGDDAWIQSNEKETKIAVFRNTDNLVLKHFFK